MSKMKANSSVVAIVALLTVILVVLLSSSHGPPGGQRVNSRGQGQSTDDAGCADPRYPARLQLRLEESEAVVKANLHSSVPNWLRRSARRVANPFKGCQEMYPDLNYSDPYREIYKLEIKLHNDTYWLQPEVRKYYQKYKREADGYSFQHCPAQVILQLDLARIPWVKTICEVGFNAGHSALTWLAANPDIKLYSFDLGSHTYTKPMGDFLAERFPGRFSLTLGDSAQTLPRFRSEHLDVKCDIMSVDGGHFYKPAILDLYNFRRMSSEANLVLFDDYPAGGIPVRDQDLGRAWEEVIENDFLTEILRCSFKHDPRTGLRGQKGIAVGHFNI